MTESQVSAPPAPGMRLCLGVTGHREKNPVYARNRVRIEAVIAEIFDRIAALTAEQALHYAGGILPTRMHSLLAEGADQLAAESALSRGWELIVPLPFGLELNQAVGAAPTTLADARAILAGIAPENETVGHKAARIGRLASQARLFELADADVRLTDLFLATLEYPDDVQTSAVFAAEASYRVQLATRVMIEHADIVVAIWDGVTKAFIGGTGHSVQMSLDFGTPVVWIDANSPEHWQILRGPEALAAATQRSERSHMVQLDALVRSALRPVVIKSAARAHHGKHAVAHEASDGFERERWRAHSGRLWHGYRRIEALFGAGSWGERLKSLRQTYESPEQIGTGSNAALIEHARALPAQEADFVAAVESGILRRFAWADGISTHLSDTYRGGMIANFVLAPLAIIGGLAYLPFFLHRDKWLFESVELALLATILIITAIGQRQRWHARWFETRRVAEYFRHAPILLLLGVARAPGRWPTGADTSWPEWYARRGLREVGLPRVKITQDYLRSALRDLLGEHVARQRDYHVGKAKRLAAAHHNLDKLSEALFVLAILCVGTYLAIFIGGRLQLWSGTISEGLSNLFTFLGVTLPTLGGAVAGIRYFGDFERFSAISEVTAEKLSIIDGRIAQLLANPYAMLDYGQVADVTRAADDTVVSEIESWQAVFSGKRVAVPV